MVIHYILQHYPIKLPHLVLVLSVCRYMCISFQISFPIFECEHGFVCMFICLQYDVSTALQLVNNSSTKNGILNKIRKRV